VAEGVVLCGPEVRMQQYALAATAIAQEARSERLFMHYALGLAVLLTLFGTALVILGLGDHLDIVVQTGGGIEGRFANASPGVVLWLVSGWIFYASKPRQLDASASHSVPSPSKPPNSAVRPPDEIARSALDEQRRRIRELADDVDQAEHYLISVEERITDIRDRAMAEQAKAQPARTQEQISGSARVLYQEEVIRSPSDNDGKA